MTIGLLGRKIGMTRVFDANGRAVPVTAIQAGPCTVVQVKSKAKEGYSAVQLGFLAKRDSLLKKPEYYHYEKCGVAPARYLREFRLAEDLEFKSGDVINVDIFKAGTKVDVSGVSKGRGFQGVMKRYGFHGMPASHGAEKNHRRPGSIGMCADPSRVHKNRKMPGHMGNAAMTVKNLDVITVDPERNILLVRGAVPGHRGGLLRIMPKGDCSHG